eukprot:TRINITY_DN3548_c0_g1_i1.p1 TRINITY_DN3548_c0_g1~~TRINITY_DN3548_c0_g1_i1.p1  ORF type:complete len:175 (+),score=31.66 TRINITY_DN3548_c0_g1_i1:22-525(+)
MTRIAAAIVFAVLATALAGNCTYKGNGLNVDLSPLTKAGGYVWQQTVGNDTWVFQVQVCEDVAPTIHPSCPKGGAIYMANPANNTCWSLGSGELFSIDEVPSKNGLMVTYYHGTQRPNNVQFLEGRLYIECNPTGDNGKPSFEHGYPHDGPYTYMYHFAWPSKIVCK